MNKAGKKINRVLAFGTLLCFLGTNVWAVPEPGISIIPQKETPGFLQVEIPKDIASIEEVYEAPPKPDPRLVLHVQNIHGNYETQMQIKKLLNYLYQKYAFKLVFVEGAIDKLDPAYLKLFPEDDRNQKLADYLAKRGELTGVEAYLMEAPNDVKAVGIEEPELYRKNYAAYKNVNEKKDEIERFLNRYEEKLELLSSHTFSPETRRLVSEWKKFHKGERDFLPYVRRLSQDARKIIGLDLESLFAQVEWPQMTRLLVLQAMEADLNADAAQKEKQKLLVFLKEKKISPEILTAIDKLGEKRITMSREDSEAARLEDLPRYLFERLVSEASPKGFYFHDYPAFSLWAGYLILQSELDSKSLFDEIERVFEKTLDQLTVTEREKNLMELYRDERLLNKLLHLELTRKEWERVAYRKEWNHPAAMLSRLKKIGREFTSPSKDLSEGPAFAQEILAMEEFSETGKYPMEDIFETAASFYDFASQRESVFMETIKKEMNSQKTEKAVLVTGGFHTQGILEMFREDSFNYSVLMPIVTGDLSTENYLSGMMESRKTMFDIAGLEAVISLQGADLRQRQGANKIYEVQTKLEAYAKFSGYQTLSELINAVNFLNSSRWGLNRKVELVPLKDQSGVFVKIDGEFIRRPKTLSDGKVINERVMVPIRLARDTETKQAVYELAGHAVLADDLAAAGVTPQTAARAEIRGYNWDEQTSSIKDFHNGYLEFMDIINNPRRAPAPEAGYILAWQSDLKMTNEQAASVVKVFVRRNRDAEYQKRDLSDIITDDKAFADLANNAINHLYVRSGITLDDLNSMNAASHGQMMIALHRLRELPRDELAALFSARAEIRTADFQALQMARAEVRAIDIKDWSRESIPERPGFTPLPVDQDLIISEGTMDLQGAITVLVGENKGGERIYLSIEKRDKNGVTFYRVRYGIRAKDSRKIAYTDQVIDLEPGQSLIIGREGPEKLKAVDSSAAVLSINQLSVSRIHARIRNLNGSLQIKDLKSTQGLNISESQYKPLQQIAKWFAENQIVTMKYGGYVFYRLPPGTRASFPVGELKSPLRVILGNPVDPGTKLVRYVKVAAKNFSTGLYFIDDQSRESPIGPARDLDLNGNIFYVGKSGDNDLQVPEQYAKDIDNVHLKMLYNTAGNGISVWNNRPEMGLYLFGPELRLHILAAQQPPAPAVDKKNQEDIEHQIQLTNWFVNTYTIFVRDGRTPPGEKDFWTAAAKFTFKMDDLLSVASQSRTQPRTAQLMDLLMKFHLLNRLWQESVSFPEVREAIVRELNALPPRGNIERTLKALTPAVTRVLAVWPAAEKEAASEIAALHDLSSGKVVPAFKNLTAWLPSGLTPEDGALLKYLLGNDIFKNKPSLEVLLTALEKRPSSGFGDGVKAVWIDIKIRVLIQSARAELRMKLTPEEIKIYGFARKRLEDSGVFSFRSDKEEENRLGAEAKKKDTTAARAEEIAVLMSNLRDKSSEFLDASLGFNNWLGNDAYKAEIAELETALRTIPRNKIKSKDMKPGMLVFIPSKEGEKPSLLNVIMILEPTTDAEREGSFADLTAIWAGVPLVNPLSNRYVGDDDRDYEYYPNLDFGELVTSLKQKAASEKGVTGAPISQAVPKPVLSPDVEFLQEAEKLIQARNSSYQISRPDLFNSILKPEDLEARAPYLEFLGGQILKLSIISYYSNKYPKISRGAMSNLLYTLQSADGKAAIIPEISNFYRKYRKLSKDTNADTYPPERLSLMILGMLFMEREFQAAENFLAEYFERVQGRKAPKEGKEILIPGNEAYDNAMSKFQGNSFAAAYIPADETSKQVLENVLRPDTGAGAEGGDLKIHPRFNELADVVQDTALILIMSDLFGIEGTRAPPEWEALLKRLRVPKMHDALTVKTFPELIREGSKANLTLLEGTITAIYLLNLNNKDRGLKQIAEFLTLAFRRYVDGAGDTEKKTALYKTADFVNGRAELRTFEDKQLAFYEKVVQEAQKLALQNNDDVYAQASARILGRALSELPGKKGDLTPEASDFWAMPDIQESDITAEVRAASEDAGDDDKIVNRLYAAAYGYYSEAFKSLKKEKPILARAETRPPLGDKALELSRQLMESVNRNGILTTAALNASGTAFLGSVDFDPARGGGLRDRISVNVVYAPRFGEVREAAAAADYALYDPTVGILGVLAERDFDASIELISKPKVEIGNIISDRSAFTIFAVVDKNKLDPEDQSGIGSNASFVKNFSKAFEAFVTKGIKPEAVEKWLVPEPLAEMARTVFPAEKIIIVPIKEKELTIFRPVPRKGFQSAAIDARIPDYEAALTGYLQENDGKDVVMHGVRLFASTDPDTSARAELRALAPAPEGDEVIAKTLQDLRIDAERVYNEAQNSAERKTIEMLYDYALQAYERVQSAGSEKLLVMLAAYIVSVRRLLESQSPYAINYLVETSDSGHKLRNILQLYIRMKIIQEFESQTIFDAFLPLLNGVVIYPAPELNVTIEIADGLTAPMRENLKQAVSLIVKTKWLERHPKTFSKSRVMRLDLKNLKSILNNPALIAAHIIEKGYRQIADEIQDGIDGAFALELKAEEPEVYAPWRGEPMPTTLAAGDLFRFAYSALFLMDLWEQEEKDNRGLKPFIEEELLRADEAIRILKDSRVYETISQIDDMKAWIEESEQMWAGVRERYDVLNGRSEQRTSPGKLQLTGRLLKFVSYITAVSLSLLVFIFIKTASLIIAPAAAIYLFLVLPGVITPWAKYLGFNKEKAQARAEEIFSELYETAKKNNDLELLRAFKIARGVEVLDTRRAGEVADGGKDTLRKMILLTPETAFFKPLARLLIVRRLLGFDYNEILLYRSLLPGNENLDSTLNVFWMNYASFALFKRAPLFWPALPLLIVESFLVTIWSVMKAVVSGIYLTVKIPRALLFDRSQTRIRLSNQLEALKYRIGIFILQLPPEPAIDVFTGGNFQARAEVRVSPKVFDVLKDEKTMEEIKLPRRFLFKLGKTARKISGADKIDREDYEQIGSGENGFMERGSLQRMTMACATCTFQFVYDADSKETYYAHSDGAEVDELDAIFAEAAARFKGRKNIYFITGGQNLNGFRIALPDKPALALNPYLEERGAMIQRAADAGFKVITAYSSFLGVDVDPYFDPEEGTLMILETEDDFDTGLEKISSVLGRAEVRSVKPEYFNDAEFVTALMTVLFSPLTDLEKKVLSDYYALDGEFVSTLKNIAVEQGVKGGKEQVRQIRNRALAHAEIFYQAAWKNSDAPLFGKLDAAAMQALHVNNIYSALRIITVPLEALAQLITVNQANLIKERLQSKGFEIKPVAELPMSFEALGLTGSGGMALRAFNIFTFRELLTLTRENARQLDSFGLSITRIERFLKGYGFNFSGEPVSESLDTEGLSLEAPTLKTLAKENVTTLSELLKMPDVKFESLTLKAKDKKQIKNLRLVQRELAAGRAELRVQSPAEGGKSRVTGLKLEYIKIMKKMTVAEIEKVSARYPGGKLSLGFSPRTNHAPLNKIFREQVKDPRFPVFSAGARVLLIGPSPDGADLEALIRQYPGMETVYIVDLDNQVFKGNDERLKKLAIEGVKLPRVEGYKINALELPDEWAEKMDMVVHVYVVDDNLFNFAQRKRFASEVGRILKPGGASLSIVIGEDIYAGNPVFEKINDQFRIKKGRAESRVTGPVLETTETAEARTGFFLGKSLKFLLNPKTEWWNITPNVKPDELVALAAEGFVGDNIAYASDTADSVMPRVNRIADIIDQVSTPAGVSEIRKIAKQVKSPDAPQALLTVTYSRPDIKALAAATVLNSKAHTAIVYVAPAGTDQKKLAELQKQYDDETAGLNGFQTAGGIMGKRIRVLVTSADVRGRLAKTGRISEAKSWLFSGMKASVKTRGMEKFMEQYLVQLIIGPNTSAMEDVKDPSARRVFRLELAENAGDSVKMSAAALLVTSKAAAEEIDEDVVALMEKREENLFDIIPDRLREWQKSIAVAVEAALKVASAA